MSKPVLKLNPFKFPHQRMRTKEGKEVFAGLMADTTNLTYMLAQYGIKLRYNEMRRSRECYIPSQNFHSDNKAAREVNFVHDLCVLNEVPMSEKKISASLQAVAEDSAFHPAREWIESKPWDGVDCMQALCETLGVAATQTAYRDRIVKRWALSAIAAIYSQNNEKAKFEGCLALQGGQGKGKTSWFNSLCPLPNTILDGHKLEPENKDNVFLVVQHWIVELGELDTTFSKSELGSIKAFLSKTYDKARKPYAAEISELKRQTVFGATVNKGDYLVDDTGNRRFWTVAVHSVNFQHGIDMQQLWAQVKVLFAQGEQWWLTADEMAEVNEINSQHQTNSAIDEMVAEAFAPAMTSTPLTLPGFEKPVEAEKANPKVWKVCASEIIELFNLQVTKVNMNGASNALRKLTGQEPKSYGGKRVWALAPRFNSRYNAALSAWQYRLDEAKKGRRPASSTR